MCTTIPRGSWQTRDGKEAPQKSRDHWSGHKVTPFRFRAAALNAEWSYDLLLFPASQWRSRYGVSGVLVARAGDKAIKAAAMPKEDRIFHPCAIAVPLPIFVDPRFCPNEVNAPSTTARINESNVSRP